MGQPINEHIHPQIYTTLSKFIDFITLAWSDSYPIHGSVIISQLLEQLVRREAQITIPPFLKERQLFLWLVNVNSDPPNLVCSTFFLSNFRKPEKIFSLLYKVHQVAEFMCCYMTTISLLLRLVSTYGVSRLGTQYGGALRLLELMVQAYSYKSRIEISAQSPSEGAKQAIGDLRIKLDEIFAVKD